MTNILTLHLSLLGYQILFHFEDDLRHSLIFFDRYHLNCYLTMFSIVPMLLSSLKSLSSYELLNTMMMISSRISSNLQPSLP